ATGAGTAGHTVARCAVRASQIVTPPAIPSRAAVARRAGPPPPPPPAPPPPAAPAPPDELCPASSATQMSLMQVNPELHVWFVSQISRNPPWWTVALPQPIASSTRTDAQAPRRTAALIAADPIR